MEKGSLRLIGSLQAWIEGEAIRQLEQAAALPDVRMAAGMPDLHPGKGFPIGAAIATDTKLYPYLVGNDIGCGMALWQTDMKVRKIKIDRLVKRLQGLEGPIDVEVAPWLETRGILPCGWDTALGTIGGGNHFAELQLVQEVVDVDAWSGLELDKESALLLIHSGSRGLGESILHAYVDKHRANGVDVGTEDGQDYLSRHEHAVHWAELNRDLIATRFLNAYRAEGRRVLNLTHNSVTRESIGGVEYWLHRKGAAPSTIGPVVIPGSRGTLTYVVLPVGDQSENLNSTAHGAGRKWNRTSAKDRLKGQYTVSQLLQTKLGSHVICDDKDLLFEEAPEAYKNIETVVHDLEATGLIRVIAILKPLITYKVKHEKERT